MGGFECSTHRIRSGRRLDMIAATRHDELAEADYRRLREIGIAAARDGLRWHLIEKEPGQYDFSSLISQVRAARTTGVQIVWDFFHYGYPDWLDLLSDEFVPRFAAFSRAAAEFLVSEIDRPLHFCPVNEISFFSWAAGRAGVFFPYKRKKAAHIKRQLVRAAIASLDVVLSVDPSARWLFTEPAIHVVPSTDTPAARRAAAKYRQAQFEGFDMLTGRIEPELGGDPRYLDVVGLNYYVHNQWTHRTRRPISRKHPFYRPPHQIFEEFHVRYQRPILLAETGIEDEKRPEWFAYVANEVNIAQRLGVPFQGLCLYPIVNHPGWEDSRHCHNGLWDYPDDAGRREAYQPLLAELRSFAPDRPESAMQAAA